MARPVETQMTISCLQCDWSVEAELVSIVVEIASRWFSSSSGDCPLGAHRQLG